MTRAARGTAQPVTLKRELRTLEAVGLSIGIVAPTLALSLNGVAVAGLVGRAVPLAFLFAAVGIGLAVYGFQVLAREHAHSGSVYAFTGATLGPRPGFLAGWALFGFYLISVPAAFAAVGFFGASFLQSTGWWSGADWLAIGLPAAVLAWAIAAARARRATRVLLAFEIGSVLLIVILFATIVVKILAGSAPAGASLTGHVFTLPTGTGVHAVALAAVFGFLSFAGFEGAATLGEETSNPRRNIPRALVLSVGIAVVIFVVGMAIESWGFGATDAGGKAFASSGAPLQNLASRYLTTGFGDVLTLGAAVSAFAAGIGNTAAANRMLFALTRDAYTDRDAPHLFTRVNKSGVPSTALHVVGAIGVVIAVSLRAGGIPGDHAFFYTATIGVLSLLVAYILLNLGAARFLASAVGGLKIRALIPLLAICFLGYTLYSSVVPVPVPPGKWFPYIAGGWLLAGLAVVVLVPGLATRIGTALARDEGLEPSLVTTASGVANSLEPVRTASDLDSSGSDAPAAAAAPATAPAAPTPRVGGPA